MRIYCKRYKGYVETEADCNCPTCVFYQELNSIYGEIYHKCTYDSWLPGLKKEKDNDK